MENDLILRKLENLRFYLQRIKEKTPSSCDLLYDDLDAQDIIVLNLSRAIQECVDIALHIIFCAPCGGAKDSHNRLWMQSTLNSLRFISIMLHYSIGLACNDYS